MSRRDEVVDVIIVGGGPAGVAAGVHAGAERLCALVVEDMAVGGQAGTSSRIENCMGFPTGISGADLCWRGEVQAIRFGTRFALPRRTAGLERRAGWSGGRMGCGRCGWTMARRSAPWPWWLRPVCNTARWRWTGWPNSTAWASIAPPPTWRCGSAAGRLWW